MQLTGHYQNAYVTHDLDKGMKIFQECFGIEDFLVFDPADMIVQVPGFGDRSYSARIATAWAGSLQFELIQPLSGEVQFYRDYLPPDLTDAMPRFHHIALRRPDPERLMGDMAQSGLPIVMKGGVPGLDFGYLDARELFGHYIELCTATDEVWQYNGWPADKHAG